MTPDKEAAVLAIPETCIDKIIALYHTSICRSPRCSENISYNEGQIFHSKSNALFEIFIKGCHICQLSRSKKLPTRQLQP